MKKAGYFAKFEADFFYFGYDVDLERYCKLLLDLVSDYEITMFEEIREDAQRNFVFLDEQVKGKLLIEISPYLNPDELFLEALEEIINNGVSHGFDFLSNSPEKKNDVHYFARLIHDTLRLQKVAKIDVMIQNYPAKLLFKIEKNDLIIGLVPQEPCAMKTFHGGISGYDVAFYLETGLPQQI